METIREKVPVAVVGGGIAGLMAAYYLSKAGASVTLYEKDTFGSGTTRYAAGMLAPVSEIEFTELDLLFAGLASRSLYNELEQDLGEIGLIRAGTIEVGLTQDDEAYLRRSFEFQKKNGLNVRWLDSKGVLELEPFASCNVPFGIHSPEDIQIDHFQLIKVLVERLPKMGVQMREHDALVQLTERAHGGLKLVCEQSEGVFAKAVIAIGASANPVISSPYKVYPIRGEVMTLVPPSNDFLKFTLRIRSRILGNAYIVPKPDCIILGTTSEERGFGQQNTFGGILNIARKCYSVVPGLFELDIMEIGAGLRPATLDRYPFIGREPSREVYHINGLYRHGILLSPLMGRAIAELLLFGRRLPAVSPFFL